MSLTYAQFVTTTANLLATPEDNTDFLQVLPSAIDYAEGRIYRQFALLATQVSVSGDPMTARTYTLPTPATGPFEVIERINIVDGDGVRTGLTPVSRDVLDTLWPSNSAPDASSIPSMFAMLTDQTIVVGPVPGAAVDVEIVGFINPTPLSSTNTTTYLTTNLPDLFVTAAMVFLSGWQKNFGSQSDSPAQAVSWESQYQVLSQGVAEVDARQAFEAASWTQKAIAPLAQPQRG